MHKRIFLRHLAVSLCGPLLLPHAEAAETAVDQVGRRLEQAQKQGKRITFQITDGEMNQYLADLLREEPRPGIDSIQLKFFHDNYISSYTVLDFDAIHRWKPGTIPALLRPALRGKNPLLLDFRLRSQGGHMTYAVEKAYMGRVQVPKPLVERVIQLVGERQSERFDLSRPLPLPMGIRQIWTKASTLHGQT